MVTLLTGVVPLAYVNRPLIVAGGVGNEFSRMLMVLSPLFTTARSGLLSPLRSPTPRVVGRDPTGIRTADPNVPSPLPRRKETSFEPLVTATRSGILSA